MMGLEPTTFCMAKAGERSRRCALVRRNLLFAAASGPASEQQRTRANAEGSHCSHCDHWSVQVRDPSRSLTHHAAAEARVTERELRTTVLRVFSDRLTALA